MELKRNFDLSWTESESEVQCVGETSFQETEAVSLMQSVGKGSIGHPYGTHGGERAGSKVLKAQILAVDTAG